MKVTHNSQEYESIGYQHQKGSVFIARVDVSKFLPCVDDEQDGLASAHAHFRLVPVRHTFGGIVFEETGDYRPPKDGEWYLNFIPEYTNRDYMDDGAVYKILKPVEVEHEHNQG